MRDVADLEDRADPGDRAGSLLGVRLAGPVDVGEVNLGLEPGCKRHPRKLGLGVYGGHDAEHRLIDRELWLGFGFE